MRVGVIAEGFADAHVIKAIVKKLMGLDGCEIRIIRPQERMDETDLKDMNFSNWQLVMESCKDRDLLDGFFNMLEGDAILVVHLDTAERGEKGYDVGVPLRTNQTDFTEYSENLYYRVCEKLRTMIPSEYHDNMVYAIAVEETDAWLIPLFENSRKDTASHVRAKETLSKLIGKDHKLKKEYVDTSKKSLDYKKLSKSLTKKLQQCRSRNKSLDLFCTDIVKHIPKPVIKEKRK